MLIRQMSHELFLSHLNNELSEYLKDDKYSDYHSLIKFVVNETSDMKVKSNLLCLLLNYRTEERVIKNLTEQLCTLYKSDTLEKYLDQAVKFNPKLGYVYIESSSGKDMKNDHSLYISLPVKHDDNMEAYFNNAKVIMDKVKEVLTMILLESKTLSF